MRKWQSELAAGGVIRGEDATRPATRNEHMLLVFHLAHAIGNATRSSDCLEALECRGYLARQ